MQMIVVPSGTNVFREATSRITREYMGSGDNSVIVCLDVDSDSQLFDLSQTEYDDARTWVKQISSVIEVPEIPRVVSDIINEANGVKVVFLLKLLNNISIRSLIFLVSAFCESCENVYLYEEDSEFIRVSPLLSIFSSVILRNVTNQTGIRYVYVLCKRETYYHFHSLPEFRNDLQSKNFCHREMKWVLAVMWPLSVGVVVNDYFVEDRAMISDTMSLLSSRLDECENMLKYVRHIIEAKNGQVRQDGASDLMDLSLSAFEIKLVDDKLYDQTVSLERELFTVKDTLKSVASAASDRSRQEADRRSLIFSIDNVSLSEVRSYLSGTRQIRGVMERLELLFNILGGLQEKVSAIITSREHHWDVFVSCVTDQSILNNLSIKLAAPLSRFGTVLSNLALTVEEAKEANVNWLVNRVEYGENEARSWADLFKKWQEVNAFLETAEQEKASTASIMYGVLVDLVSTSSVSDPRDSINALFASSSYFEDFRSKSRKLSSIAAVVVEHTNIFHDERSPIHMTALEEGDSDFVLSDPLLFSLKLEIQKGVVRLSSLLNQLHDHFSRFKAANRAWLARNASREEMWHNAGNASERLRAIKEGKAERARRDDERKKSLYLVEKEKEAIFEVKGLIWKFIETIVVTADLHPKTSVHVLPGWSSLVEIFPEISEVCVLVSQFYSLDSRIRKEL